MADDTSTAGVVEPVLPVQETGQESGKQDVPAVEVIHAEDLTAGVDEPVLPVRETDPGSVNQGIVSAMEVIYVKDQTVGVVLPVQETGPISGKQDNAPVHMVEVVEDQNTTTPVDDNR